jgi:hypothetical protein
MLGATDEISIKQYCRVLEIIKNEANGSKVIPEEMNRSEKAIIGVLDYSQLGLHNLVVYMTLSKLT